MWIGKGFARKIFEDKIEGSDEFYSINEDYKEDPLLIKQGNLCCRKMEFFLKYILTSITISDWTRIISFSI